MRPATAALLAPLGAADGKASPGRRFPASTAAALALQSDRTLPSVGLGGCHNADRPNMDDQPRRVSAE